MAVADEGGDIRVTVWDWLLGREPISRTDTMRLLLTQQTAQMQAETPPPVVKWRLPDGRERMQGKVQLTQFQVYQQRVQARLRQRA